MLISKWTLIFCTWSYGPCTHFQLCISHREVGPPAHPPDTELEILVELLCQSNTFMTSLKYYHALWHVFLLGLFTSIQFNLYSTRSQQQLHQGTFYCKLNTLQKKTKKIFVLVYGLCVKMCKNYNVDFFFNTWKILKSQKYHVARDWSYVVLCLLNTLALGRLNHLRSKPLSVMTPTITLWTLNLCNQNISFLFLLNFSPRLAIGQHRK